MKIYVATAFGNAPEALEVMAYLTAIGHTITHDWTKEKLDTTQSPEEQTKYLYDCGSADFEGVGKADALVLVNHADSRDAMTEFGIALGLGMPIVVLHPERRGSVFFGRSRVYLAEGMPEMLAQVTRLARGSG